MRWIWKIKTTVSIYLHNSYKYLQTIAIKIFFLVFHSVKNVMVIININIV